MNRGTQRGFGGQRGAHSDPQQHNRQYADAQYQTYEPQPRQDYREYENTRRGRGRTGGNRSKKTPVSQSLQKATAPPPSGPPAPTRLSKASSTPKNDPIYHEALMPEPGQEGRPLADTLKNFPSFKGIPGLTRQLHETFKALDPGYARRISESMLAYYVACHALARMYKIKDKNGIVLTFNERSYMDSVYGLHGSLAQLISTYLSGFGNITSESGREYKCSFRRLEYVPGPNHMHGGWFGQIDQDNHFMYMEYPCLAVFAERIIRDYGFNVHQDARDWDLPDGIRPDADWNAGLPTPNLLGYNQSVNLSRDQIAVLQEAGLNAQGRFEADNDDIPLWLDLLRAIQTELDHAKFKGVPLTDSAFGSQGQCVTITMPRPPERFVAYELRNPVIATYQPNVQGSIVVAAQAYVYRHECCVSEEDLNGWAIYNFDEYANVPVAWGETANTLINNSPPILNCSYWHADVPSGYEVIKLESGNTRLAEEQMVDAGENMEYFFN
ncbi:unnamed protein product [Brassicogethes aeneus]|uniref:Uncharacterized protein n=1 Tax=Brassicogethes aeneus TaxID=1431903 RepID=A0A9P0BFZ9_BRAAE|nr:unnamed protein product [Brassicogethes aeneus]